MKIVMWLSVALFSLPWSSDARIIEVSKMSEALAPVETGTLLIFDLDNTIVEPRQTLGSDQWFEHVLSREKKKTTDEKAALKNAIDLWERVQRVTKVRLVEEQTAGLIATQQANGIKIMGLTARPLTLEPYTREQLKSVAVDLSITRVYPKNVPLVAGKVEYRNGILFMGPAQSKGEVLLQFLKKINLKPKRIVFVDDRKHNIESVEGSVSKTDMELLAMRYGAADATVKAFRPDVADLELKVFDGLLSDEEALRLLQTGAKN